MLKKRPIIGVVGSHSEAWEDFSRPLGKFLAESGVHLLTGGGAGVMSEVAKAFTDVQDREGLCIGVLPMTDPTEHHGQKKMFPNPYIEIPVFTLLDQESRSDVMPFSLNHTNVMTPHAIIVLPGFHGTMNEVSMAIAYQKPFVLYGPEDAFKAFPENAAFAETLETVEHFLSGIFVKGKK